MKGTKLIRHISWGEVLRLWQGREDGPWQDWFRERGHDNWHDFRLGKDTNNPGTLQKYALWDFDLEELKWEAWRVSDADAVLPHIHVGPYSAWREYGGVGRGAANFAEVAKPDRLADNDRVQTILAEMRDSEQPRRAIALFHPEKQQLMLIDGHHTLSAFSLAHFKHLSLRAPLVLHVGRVKAEDYALFDKILADT